MVIVTLTINPAIDRNVTVDRLVFEDRAYILSTRESPGGRGINASWVIHAFGGETLAIATKGGRAGDRFAEMLKTACSNGPYFEFAPMRNEIRTNLTISDRQGLTIKLNEIGSPLGPDELEAVECLVSARIEGAAWLMLCGSIPPGVPPDFYYRLIRMARSRGVKTLLDTDGDALLRGLDAQPTAVAPNQAEAERLLNRALITRSHFLEAAERIRAMGAESVVLSLGSRGAVGSSPGLVVEAIPPRIEAVCPIGAGDALAAAFTWAMSRSNDFPDAVRWGVAGGTASAMLPGVSFAGLDETRAIYDKVEMRTSSWAATSPGA